MKTSIKTSMITLAVLVIAATTMAGPALQVQVATTGVYDYQATVVQGPIGAYDTGDTFRTFCLERQSHTGNQIFNVAIEDKAIGTGESLTGDPLDTKTAFLYNEFLNGGLAGYGIGNDAASYKIMQNVVWNIEGEGAVINLGTGTTGGDLLAYAEANADGSNYGIRVMVMQTLAGAEAQDMMVKTALVVPTPGAVVLGGIGVSFVGWLRRRKTV